MNERDMIEDSSAAIISKSLSGAKWLLYLSASALVVGFGTNVLLGRLDPEILGFYTLLMLVVSLTSTFFVLGGPNVLVNYLPHLDLRMKSRFSFSYALIVFGFGAAFLLACVIYPPLLELIFRKELNVSVHVYISLLLPVLLAQVLVWAILQAEMEVKVLAISQNAVSMFYFVNIGFIFLFGFLAEANASVQHHYVLIAVLISNIVALLIGFGFLFRSHFRRWGTVLPTFLPGGFWKFTLSLHMGTLFNFLILNAAPVFVLRELSLRDLGYFRAASVLALFVSWAPGVLDRSFYPSFCNLLGKNFSLDDAYARFSKLAAFGSSIVALLILLFAQELLGIFGKEFGESGLVLLRLLSAGLVVTTPFIMVDFAIVTAYQKTMQTMTVYAIVAVTGLVSYALMVPILGLSGIGWAHISVQLLLFVFGATLARRYARVSLPIKSYLISLCALLIGMGAGLLFDEVSWLTGVLKSLAFLLFFVLVFSYKLASKTEAMELLNLLLPLNISRLYKRLGLIE